VRGQGIAGRMRRMTCSGTLVHCATRMRCSLHKREPKLGRREDPLKWWSHNNERYPGLAAAAQGPSGSSVHLCESEACLLGRQATHFRV